MDLSVLSVLAILFVFVCFVFGHTLYHTQLFLFSFFCLFFACF